MWVVGIPGVPGAAGVRGAAEYLGGLDQAGEGGRADLLPAATAHKQAQAGPELSVLGGRVPSLVGHQDPPSGLLAARAPVHTIGVRR
jgi:hypothetical protein